MSRVHNLIGASIEPERMDRIGEPRFWATYWFDFTGPDPAIAVGNIVHWNPAKDVDTLATFKILSIIIPQSCNGIYKIEFARILVDIHIAGETYTREQMGHLIRQDDDGPENFRRYSP